MSILLTPEEIGQIIASEETRPRSIEAMIAEGAEKQVKKILDEAVRRKLIDVYTDSEGIKHITVDEGSSHWQFWSKLQEEIEK